MNFAQRQAVITRYLAALRDVGDAKVGGVRVRDSLRCGNTDLWVASELRESSLWRDSTLFDQIGALVEQQILDDHQSEKQPRRRTLQTTRLGVQLRSVAAWSRALLHAIKRTTSESLDADIIFVEYWPSTVVVDEQRPENWSSPYFRALPNALRDAGYTVGFAHLHADGPVTVPPSNVRESFNALTSRDPHHVLFADYHGFSTWFGALRTWLSIIRRAPKPSTVGIETSAHPDAHRLWRWWSAKYARSVFGSHAVRSCLVSEFARRLVADNQRTQLWVLAFEGQSWESCLTRQLDAAGARWIPYVHTMMRPWDLRAHTFLSEVPPRCLAVHGQHDHDELHQRGVRLVHVEALRYQQLGDAAEVAGRRAASTTPRDRRWLVVGGADCQASAKQLADLINAATSNGIERKLVVKWHPQCRRPNDLVHPFLEWSNQPLHELARSVDAALMVGSAAPLDTYLAGVPSCSFAEISGLSMTPIEEGDFFHLAIDATDAVHWLAAADSRRNESPPVSRYFNTDERLLRWHALVGDVMTSMPRS